MAGSGKIKGKQIIDNSMNLSKISNGIKILGNSSTLGVDKNPSEIINDKEFVTKEYVDFSIKESFFMEFVLSESVTNTNEFFFSWRGRGNNSSGGYKSNRQNGLAQVCSPIMIPFDMTLKSATLVIKSSGVNNATVTFPVLYMTKLYVVGFNQAQDPGINGGIPFDINFDINSGIVGTFALGNTETVSNLDNLDIDLDRGQMIGLEFDAGVGASEIALTQRAYVSFNCEKR